MKPIVVDKLRDACRTLSAAYIESDNDSRLRVLRDRTEESVQALLNNKSDPHAAPPMKGMEDE